MAGEKHQTSINRVLREYVERQHRSAKDSGAGGVL